ncbi:unnamed protein product [Closterium sp. Naga37s-1]|nr:unnamed protein product [Closterium sp. Naga37s-1]
MCNETATSEAKISALGAGESGSCGAAISLAVTATSPQVEEYKDKATELVDVAKSKWETVENKPLVALYAGGAVVGLWITSAILGAIDSIPLVPGFLKLVGTVYTGWFAYRYLIFEASRKELSEKVADLVSQIK